MLHCNSGDGYDPSAESEGGVDESDYVESDYEPEPYEGGYECDI